MSRGAVLYIKMPGKSRTQHHIENIKGINMMRSHSLYLMIALHI
jgi:hypothetical protein